MAKKERTPKVGDTILYHGFPLTIYALETVPPKLDADGKELRGSVVRVRADDQDARKRRRAAKAEVQALREQQAALDPEDAIGHRELATQIRAVSGEALQGIIDMGLRLDRLTWWDEKGVWTKSGMILTDDQRAAYCRVMGLRNAKKIRPEQERTVLVTLEALGDPSVQEPPAVTRKEG